MADLDLGSAAGHAWSFAATARIAPDDPLDDPGRLQDWLPARVPGCVQRDLMRAGRLPDLYATPHPEQALAYVHEQDWWYRLKLASIERDQRAWLRFSGVDYMAAITLDGVELGRGPGMFARRQFEVTDALRESAGDLAVRLWGAGALPAWPDTPGLRLRRRLLNRLQGGIPAFDDRLLTLKAPVHFGWDFAPRLLPTGVWDDVSLHVAHKVGLLDVWARADWGHNYGLVVQLMLDADSALRCELCLNLTQVNKLTETQVLRRDVRTRPGQQMLSLKWPEARLLPWSTHERGIPHLYRLEIKLTAGDEILDEVKTTVGMRTVGWEPPPAGEGEALRLYLNGEPLRLRGVNWVPAEGLPGAEDEGEREQRLLQAAVEAGVNAVRVWGGGGRMRKHFYDLCDELGLFVWQELPIACVFIDRIPEDAAFLELARRETRGIVRALRGHPSLLMWGGGNEWGPGRHRLLTGLLGEVVSQEDPSRRWLPASPGPGDSHNWRVWHGQASPERYADDPAPLLSEFGLAAPPDVDALSAMLPPHQLWPPGPAWLARHAEPEKLWRYARPLLTESRAQTSLEAFVLASQEAQGRGLQAGIEAYRLRPKALGTFIWQWNEPWPAICWSVIPYSGPPKRAYRQIARSYSPLAPLARILPEGLELWVVNDRLESPGPCLFTARLDDQVIWQGEVSPAANDRLRIAVLDPPPVSARRLELELQRAGLDLKNDYLLDLAWLRLPARRRPVGWLRERFKAWLLRW